jgi:hypothetical protein
MARASTMSATTLAVIMFFFSVGYPDASQR